VAGEAPSVENASPDCDGLGSHRTRAGRADGT